MLINIINIILAVIYIVAIGIVAIIAIIAFIIWLASRSNEKMLREKYGENYDAAMSKEFSDVECKPYPVVIDKKHIDEKYCPNIKLPNFHVRKCISHMRHFTGDTSETVYIEFISLPDQNIFNSCRHVSKVYSDEAGIRHAVIKYMSDEEMIEWSIDIPENSLSAQISYRSM